MDFKPMDRAPNDNVDWWAVSVNQRKVIKDMRATIDWIATALPVLETMCKVAGLKMGAAKAREMIEYLESRTFR